MLRRMWLTNPMGYESQPSPDKPMYFNYNRLSFFIGKNNSGKSRFLRSLFKEWCRSNHEGILDFVELHWLYSIIDDKNCSIDRYVPVRNKNLHIKQIIETGFPSLKDNSGRFVELRADIIDLLEGYKEGDSSLTDFGEKKKKDLADAELYFERRLKFFFLCSDSKRSSTANKRK